MVMADGGGPPLWALRWILFSGLLCAGIIAFFFWQFWDTLGWRQMAELGLIGMVGPGFILVIKLPRDLRKHSKPVPFSMTEQRFTLGKRRAVWSSIVDVELDARPEGAQLTVILAGDAAPMVVYGSSQAMTWLHGRLATFEWGGNAMRHRSPPSKTGQPNPRHTPQDGKR